MIKFLKEFPHKNKFNFSVEISWPSLKHNNNLHNSNFQSYNKFQKQSNLNLKSPHVQINKKTQTNNLCLISFKPSEQLFYKKIQLKLFAFCKSSTKWKNLRDFKATLKFFQSANFIASHTKPLFRTVIKNKYYFNWENTQ